jgi:hypothetical protein
MRRANPDLADAITALDALSREDLSKCWQAVYGVAPPKGIRRDLLLRSAAWHLQAKRLGGISQGTRRALRVAMTCVEQTTLAPEGPIVAGLEQILSGRQPVDLTARRLARLDLPLGWPDQACALS